jgi:coenzyme PQQ precursor peptide PqqA
MNNEPELIWSEPDFEEISTCMECTAYSEAL